MLGELLEMFLQGSQGNQDPTRGGTAGQGSAGQDPLGGLLEELLGGAQAAGGRGQASGGGLEDILGGILGGGSGAAPGNVGGNPLMAPFTEALSEKLGISPQMASIIISAAISLLVGAIAKSNQPGATSEPALPNLDELLDEDFLATSGAAAQVSRQTGMEEAEASKSLQEALVLLTGAGGAPHSEPPRRQPPKKTSTMDDLLDTWEVDG